MLHLGGILLLTWFQNFPSSCFSNIKIIYPLLDLWHTVTSELASKLPDKHYFWHTMAATLLVCGQGGRGFYAVWILVCTCILVDLKYQHSQNMCCLSKVGILPRTVKMAGCGLVLHISMRIGFHTRQGCITLYCQTCYHSNIQKKGVIVLLFS